MRARDVASPAGAAPAGSTARTFLSAPADPWTMMVDGSAFVEYARDRDDFGRALFFALGGCYDMWAELVSARSTGPRTYEVLARVTIGAGDPTDQTLRLRVDGTLGKPTFTFEPAAQATAPSAPAKSDPIGSATSDPDPLRSHVMTPEEQRVADLLAAGHELDSQIAIAMSENFGPITARREASGTYLARVGIREWTSPEEDSRACYVRATAEGKVLGLSTPA